MIDDEHSQPAKKDAEPSTQSPLPELAKSVPAPIPPPPVKPAAPIGKLDTDSGGKNNESKKDCVKEISVEIKKDWMERVSFHIGWITLAFVILTFVVFYRQLNEAETQTGIFRDQAAQAKIDTATQLGIAKSSLDASDEAFRLDQRPIIWMANGGTDVPRQLAFSIEPVSAGSTAKRAVVDFYFTNFGKSTALNVRTSSGVAWGKGSMKAVRLVKFSSGTRVMPPGKIDFSSFASDTLNDTDIPYVTGDEGFSVKMRLNYQDAKGFPYQTNYCLSRLQSGAWRFCESGNSIKDCSKEQCN